MKLTVTNTVRLAAIFAIVAVAACDQLPTDSISPSRVKARFDGGTWIGSGNFTCSTPEECNPTQGITSAGGVVPTDTTKIDR